MRGEDARFASKGWEWGLSGACRLINPLPCLQASTCSVPPSHPTLIPISSLSHPSHPLSGVYQSFSLSPSLNLLCSSFSSLSHSYLNPCSSFSSSKWGLSGATNHPFSHSYLFTLAFLLISFSSFSSSKWGLTIPYPSLNATLPHLLLLLVLGGFHPPNLPSTPQSPILLTAVATLFLTCAHFLQSITTALPLLMAQDDDDDQDKVYISQSILAWIIWSWYIIALWSQEVLMCVWSSLGSRMFFTMFQGLQALLGVLGRFQGRLDKTVFSERIKMAGTSFCVCVFMCLCACVFVFVCVYVCVFGCSHSMGRKVAGSLCVCALNELTRTSMRALPQTSGPSFIQQSRKVSQFCKEGGGSRSYLSSLWYRGKEVE